MPRRRDEYEDDEEFDAAVDEGVGDGGKTRRKRGRLDYAEEDDEDYGRRRGKRNRQAALEVFDIKAAVDSDEEEEEEGDDGGRGGGGRIRGKRNWPTAYDFFDSDDAEDGDKEDDEFIDVGADIPNEADSRIHQRIAQTRSILRDPLSPMRRPPRGGDSGLGNIGGATGDDDALIGVAAKICRGGFKGCWGSVKDVIGSRVRIELESQLKIVEVHRSNVYVSPFRKIWRYGMDPKIPMHPFRTPMRDSGVVGGATEDDDALIGVAAKICRGGFKGCWGSVKDVIGSRVRIELESQLKIVEVHRSHVYVSPFRKIWRYGMDPKIPMHPFRTPMRDSGGVIPSPPHPGTDELPTEDIIMGGRESIFGPNGDSCRICLEEYKAKERLRLIRKCNHCFHVDCLYQWLIRKGSCPICRTTVN